MSARPRTKQIEPISSGSLAAYLGATMSCCSFHDDAAHHRVRRLVPGTLRVAWRAQLPRREWRCAIFGLHSCSPNGPFRGNPDMLVLRADRARHWPAATDVGFVAS